MAKKMFFKSNRAYTISLVKRPRNQGTLMLDRSMFLEGPSYYEFSVNADPHRGFLVLVPESEVLVEWLG